MKKIIFGFLFLIFSFKSNCQTQNSIWCFGDSAGIDFNNINNPVPVSSSINSRGTCVSISDTSGNLLFYAGTRSGVGGNTGLIYNKINSIMQNGDSILGQGWYKEMVIIPFPDNDSMYYLISIGVTSATIPGLFYCVLNLNSNGGLGDVIQKNIQLENFNMVDCLTAIKHGNGRDWWIALRNASTMGNTHYIYYISPSGISSPLIQSVGSANNTNAGRYTFSPDGSLLAFINYTGLLEIYNFDRCSGMLSNATTIHPEPTTLPISNFWSCEFSPSGRFLYVSSITDTSYLYQYDLLASNIAMSRITLNTITDSQIGNAALKLAPDNKIYLSSAWECYAIPSCYPYPDSVFNTVNMNLSVVNHPDSLGTLCDYTSFSFYLGGKRTYYGLPNNPDYNLSALSGSICDTLTSILETSLISDAEFFAYYTTEWQTTFLNANKLKGTKYQLEVYDLLGKLIFRENGYLYSPYFNKNLNCSSFSKGMYLVNFVTDKERLVKRFVVR